MDESKVESILTPKTRTVVRSFHGLAQLYRKIIRGFSEICAPVLDTIKGGLKAKFLWTKEANEGFERLKKEVPTKPILILPSFDKLFIVECDASNIVIGAILNHEGRLVVFFSERLNKAKSEFSSYDLELYALVQALRKWRHYLLPEEFLVYTDNQELSYINTQEKLSLRHIKWMEFLKSYTYHQAQERSYQ